MLAVILAAAPAAGAAPLERCRDDASARCGSVRVPVYRSEPGSGRFLLAKAEGRALEWIAHRLPAG